MITRETAKCVITCEDGKYFFVAGSRGMLNCAGGGIDEPETPKKALLRELDEEIENLSSLVTDPIKLFEFTGRITPKQGGEMLAHWTVFGAGLLVPSSELRIATDSEITATAALSLQECFTHPHISDLATMAVERAFNLEHSAGQDALAA